MFSVSNLSVSFSGNTLFDELSFLINKNDKIGLVGRNGVGKSTLLKVISGSQSYDTGSLSKPNDFTIGYLPQEMVHQDGKTVLEEAMTAFEEVLALHDEIVKMEDEFEHMPTYDHDLVMAKSEILMHLQDKYHHLGGDTIEGDTERILKGLGFNPEDFNMQTSTFSGGWRMRIQLAKILLQKPNLLLLDEPTNHLDIESVQWLEGFLKYYSGAIMMVSHDRRFLDVITNRTLEITKNNLYDYKVPYSEYITQRAERMELLKSSFENQQKEIKHAEDFINRFKAKASKAKQAQSRMKALDKVVRIELDEEDTSQMNLRFAEPPRSGQMIYNTHNLCKSYGDKEVLRDVVFEINRGDKVALVGKNGQGKSTLTRIMAELEPHTGLLEKGYNVIVGFFAQNQAETLDPNLTVFETIDNIAKGDMRTKVRNILGSFLFSGDDVDKKVKVLSGGEKSRLAMAKLLLQPVNLLVMDEPTNHLDMNSKDVLKRALQKFSGSMVIVSHDREFLEGLANKVFEVKDKRVKIYHGGIEEYIDKNAQETADQKLSLKAEKVKPAPAQVQPKTNAPFTDEQKKLDNRKKKLEKTIAETENQIQEVEAEMKKLEELLSVPTADGYHAAIDKYHQASLKYKERLEVWEKLTEELEGLKVN